MATFQNTTEAPRLVELVELFEVSMRMYVVNDERATTTAGDEHQQHRERAAYWVDLAVDQAIEIGSIDARTAWGVDAKAKAFELIADHEPAGVMSASEGVTVPAPKP